MKTSCKWCKGTGRIYLKGHKPIVCLNCHGTGKGKDGGRHGITTSNKSYMIGNHYYPDKRIRGMFSKKEEVCHQ